MNPDHAADPVGGPDAGLAGDFGALREQVEQATRVPDFTEVGRRAKRVRRRDRIAVGGALMATLAVFTPVAVVAVAGRPVDGPTLIGPNPQQSDFSPEPGPVTGESDPPVTITLRASAGRLSGRIYAAVDVCIGPASGRRCSLQVSPLPGGTGERRSPIAANVLRKDPTEPISDVRLDPMSATTFLLSGQVGNRPRTYLQVSEAGTRILEPPEQAQMLAPGDHAVQLAVNGDIFAVRQANGGLSLIPRQPNIAQRTIATGIAPQLGWWVTGSDPISGQPTVAVSHDQGETWTVRALDAPSGLTVPVVATPDGVTAYAFVRTTTGLYQLRTSDSGQTWTRLPHAIPLPGGLSDVGGLAGREVGAVVRPDGSILLWIEDAAVPIFMESVDGVTYRRYSGPDGHIIAMDDGFVAIGEQPELSADGRNWVATALPSPILPD